MVAPASAYLSSFANAPAPAPDSTATSTFHFLKVAKCSGKTETLVSGDESFNTPTIISFINCGEGNKKSIDDAKVLLYLNVGIYANDADEKQVHCESYLRM